MITSKKKGNNEFREDHFVAGAILWGPIFQTAGVAAGGFWKAMRRRAYLSWLF
jgi:hypothetical protein